MPTNSDLIIMIFAVMIIVITIILITRKKNYKKKHNNLKSFSSTDTLLPWLIPTSYSVQLSLNGVKGNVGNLSYITPVPPTSSPNTNPKFTVTVKGDSSKYGLTVYRLLSGGTQTVINPVITKTDTGWSFTDTDNPYKPPSCSADNFVISNFKLLVPHSTGDYLRTTDGTSSNYNNFIFDSFVQDNFPYSNFYFHTDIQTPSTIPYISGTQMLIAMAASFCGSNIYSYLSINNDKRLHTECLTQSLKNWTVFKKNKDGTMDMYTQVCFGDTVYLMVTSNTLLYVKKDINGVNYITSNSIDDASPFIITKPP